MKPKIGPVRLASGGRLAFLAVGLVVCGACASKESQPATNQTPSLTAQVQRNPTHAPPFKLMPDLILQRKSDFASHVAKDLSFETGTAVDDRRLLKGPPNALVVGPHATLASESGAAALDTTWVWANLGRVVARITLDDSYPLLSLQKGTTYVCVVRDVVNDYGNIWAVLAGVDKNTVTYTARLPLKVKDTTGPARWIVGTKDDNFCVPCNSKYCCTQK